MSRNHAPTWPVNEKLYCSLAVSSTNRKKFCHFLKGPQSEHLFASFEDGHSSDSDHLTPRKMKPFYCWLIVAGSISGILGGYPWEDSKEESGSTTCSCGWVNGRRIVGGKETQENEFPLVVSLEYKLLNFHVCGGTILTPWHVLTAAHCTFGVDESDLAVNVGAHDLGKSVGNSRIDVAKIINHERYVRRVVANDIALLVTASEIRFNQHVGPACLPTKRLTLTGQHIKALGWGLTSHGGQPSNVLQEVDLRVVNFTRCHSDWEQSQKRLRPREKWNICTFETNKDTCKGDSGGPLVWKDPSSNRFSIVALVSFGGECGGKLPAVNTDVTAYLPWINKNIEESKQGVKACAQL